MCKWQCTEHYQTGIVSPHPHFNEQEIWIFITQNTHTGTVFSRGKETGCHYQRHKLFEHVTTPGALQTY